jgi:hypothetical protein
VGGLPDMTVVIPKEKSIQHMHKPSGTKRRSKDMIDES